MKETTAIDRWPDADPALLAALPPDVVREGSRRAAAAGRVLPRVVHGADNREPVADSTRFPASAIAQLVITASNGEVFGATGTFIHPNVLLTAGHAVFVPGAAAVSGEVRQVVVIPGRNGTQQPFGAVAAVGTYAPVGWKRSALPDLDFGLVFVPRFTGRVFDLAVLADAQLVGLSVLLAGYPIDKPVGTQWYDKRVIAGVSGGQVAYDIDTEGGQSGAPVFAFRDDRAHLVAVHRFGAFDVNYGTRITAAVQADVTSAIGSRLLEL